MPKLPPPTILGLLQNQWFKDPERIPRIMELYNRYEDQLEEPPRNRFIRDMLFFGCQTGKRLRKYLGEELCSMIIWEEVSPQIGGKANSIFPPDSEHIIKAFTNIRPNVVVAFGGVANSAFNLPEVLIYMQEQRVVKIPCCHPAARWPTDVESQILGVKVDLLRLLA